MRGIREPKETQPKPAAAPAPTKPVPLFSQIAAAGDAVYGLDSRGFVYRFCHEEDLWRPLRMVEPVETE